jgi:nicotinamidase-related amidase
MKTGLILVDIQNDYFPGGRMELTGMVEASSRANNLLSFFRESYE